MVSFPFSETDGTKTNPNRTAFGANVAASEKFPQLLRQMPQPLGIWSSQRKHTYFLLPTFLAGGFGLTFCASAGKSRWETLPSGYWQVL